MNSFYASVEIMLHPELRGKAVAVCGSEKERHGIVLAKSDAAKKAGVKTGMSNHEALNACPGLILRAPDYKQYIKFSHAAREIYGRFTDYIEPFGMDECWLDVTDSRICGTGPEIAEKIRTSIHEELGLTVSVGVSWNKIFAKLGSDMKKPDAVTVITKENYKKKVWPLPVGDLLYAGPATVKKLHNVGINTIGELAAADERLIKKMMGINGLKLISYARGTDESRVMHKSTVIPPKSIGHGVTCIADLKSDDEIKRVILELSQEIGRRLREENCTACTVHLSLRSHDLSFTGAGTHFLQPTRSPAVIADTAFFVYLSNFSLNPVPVRQVTVTVTDFICDDEFMQPSLFVDQDFSEKLDNAETALYEIRRRFGEFSVIPASLLLEKKIPHDGRDLVKMPNIMYS
ncbi:MAG: DNA polymerase IV [Lachnospiraceae bacterium]|nr:DNA polymerase IV [Lachnospiraceae bacterium]